MEVKEKLEILSDSAKYDASCSSSGSARINKNGIGNGSLGGICHSFSSDGRCVSLLKILMTNVCIFDCKYCINRRTNNIKRAIFTPQEIADLTINFYKRNYIEGLFLSSGIIKNPDYTMSLMIEAITILRKKYNFNGYIHAKAIPGASDYLIKKMGLLVDRMSTNIELPSSDSLQLLAPDKNKENLIKNFNTMEKYKEEKNFVSAGKTTQLIIGATNESDYKIMNLSNAMYKKYSLKRVYYSAYVSVNKDNLLPTLKEPPLKRENRLYQADWLLRFYGFKVEDLFCDENENLDLRMDPKCAWALKNIEEFPKEINKCKYEELIKIPGLGIISAKKIISVRKYTHLTFDDLKHMGVSLKKAKYFITCDGKYYEKVSFFRKDYIEQNLIEEKKKIEQLCFFGGEYEAQ